MKAIKFILGIITILSFTHAEERLYSPRGVGGGGAMAGYSISPNSDLRFVGTDMGTLFRSTDRGNTWNPISHTQVGHHSDLNLASGLGFTADPKTLFFSEAGRDPKRSRDGGVTWAPTSLPLRSTERIRYWNGEFCATNEGLFRSTDLGDTWVRVEDVNGKSQGTVISGEGASRKVFHATESGIFIAEGNPLRFRKWFTPEGTQIRAFTGGSDTRGHTLAFIDTQGKEACAWARSESTFSDCGWVWIHRGTSEEPLFLKTNKEGGRFIRMAENDSQTIYLTGGDWIKQHGSKIWVTRNAGATWNLKFSILDRASRPNSAVGLDVGWHENAPFSFAVNSRDSSEAGVTGHYFLHVTRDFGEKWKAPFTQFSDSGEPAPQKKWKSTGLEVASVLRLKFHPANPKLGYAAVSDLGGFVTEDGGATWRISKAKYNTNYDYAFDPAKPDLIYSASGDQHDFPLNNNNSPIKGEGGIFSSVNRGRHWKRLTPDSGPLNRQFLSVAYDPNRRILYAGTQGEGIVRSPDEGKNWETHNDGFPEGNRVIPQIEIDPLNGAVYALLTGNAPQFTNSSVTGIYRLLPGPESRWELLRSTVVRPSGVDLKNKLWLFPSAFSIDFSRPNRDVLWLTDIENQGSWLASGIWKSTDSGRTWNRMSQFTYPTSITLDPDDGQKAYASGPYDMTGKWGLGGALSTRDGGKSWKKNQHLPLLANLFGFTPDPLRSENGFYLFFGGGIFYGPKFPR